LLDPGFEGGPFSASDGSFVPWVGPSSHRQLFHPALQQRLEFITVRVVVFHLGWTTHVGITFVHLTHLTNLPPFLGVKFFTLLNSQGIAA
jgi:hypothetical protein